STIATPAPSWVRSTTSAARVSRAALRFMPRGPPGFEELEQMRLGRLRELRLEQLELRAMSLLVEHAAQELEAKVDQIRVQHVVLAVVADRRNLTAHEALPDARTAHAELAWKAEQHGDLLECRPRARAVTGEHVHEVDVPPVES